MVSTGADSSPGSPGSHVLQRVWASNTPADPVSSGAFANASLAGGLFGATWITAVAMETEPSAAVAVTEAR